MTTSLHIADADLLLRLCTTSPELTYYYGLQSLFLSKGVFLGDLCCTIDSLKYVSTASIIGCFSLGADWLFQSGS